MSRQQEPSRQVPVNEQIQAVLKGERIRAVLKGELPLAGAARRHGVSSTTWQLRIHHTRLASPPDTAISVWPLVDPLLDPEVPCDQ